MVISTIQTRFDGTRRSIEEQCPPSDQTRQLRHKDSAYPQTEKTSNNCARALAEQSDALRAKMQQPSEPHLALGGVELLAVQPDVVVGPGLRRQQVCELVREPVRVPVLRPVLPRRLCEYLAGSATGRGYVAMN